MIYQLGAWNVKNGQIMESHSRWLSKVDDSRVTLLLISWPYNFAFQDKHIFLNNSHHDVRLVRAERALEYYISLALFYIVATTVMPSFKLGHLNFNKPKSSSDQLKNHSVEITTKVSNSELQLC